MAVKQWRGDAPAVCQQDRVDVYNVEVDKVYALQISNKTVSVTSTVDDEPEAIIDALVTAINASSFPEWQEVTASKQTDSTVDPPVKYLRVQADTCGKPFTMTVSDETSAHTISITEETAGAPGQNERQRIEFIKAPTGGTFTLSWNPGTGTETTGNIDYDATAAEVQTALEGLASVSSGDIQVTGGPGPDAAWTVTFKGTYEETDVALISMDGTNLTGAAEVQITTDTEGLGLSNALHVVQGAIDAPTSSPPSYTLTYFGETTAAIAMDANPQSALEALPSIGAGNVTVQGSYHLEYNGDYATKHVAAWAICFTGELAGQAISLPTIGDEPLTATSLQDGGQSAYSEWQWVNTHSAGETVTLTSGNPFATYSQDVQFSYDDESTGAIPYSDLSQSDDEIEALSTVDFTVVAHRFKGDFTSTLHVPFIVFELQGAADRSQIECTNAGGTSSFTPTYGTFMNGNSAGVVSEVQNVIVGGTGGTFTLTFDGQETGNIAYNASAATVETALEGLSTITNVTVTGTGASDDPYVVTFVDPGGDVALMTADATSLTGGGAIVTTVQEAASSTDEEQQIELQSVTGGTFTLTFQGQTTSAIAYDASAATVESALEALGLISGVSVSGSAGGPWTVTFDGSTWGGYDVPLIVGDGSNLTGGDTSLTLARSAERASTGPEHWDEDLNWEPEGVPTDSDDVHVDLETSSIKYGLDQSAVTLTSLNIKQSFNNGQVGLPDINEDGNTNYFEYRGKYLQIGATTVNIGEGDGDGYSLIRIDNGSVQAELNVLNSGSPQGQGDPNVEWIGTHSDNVVNVIKGLLGIANHPGQSATVKTLRVGYMENQSGDSLVICGSGVTLDGSGATVEITGGEVEIGSATAKIVQTAGELDLLSSGHALIIVDGGTMYYRGSGTLTDLKVAGDGVANFSRNMQARTITDCELSAGASLLDPFETVTFTNAIRVNRTRLSELTLDLGNHFDLQRTKVAT